MSDPFADHPHLRNLVGDPEASFYRDFDYAPIDAMMAERGFPPDWRLTDTDREATRRAALDGHGGPLWVFAYGSLMWDPSMRFDTVRIATAPGHARHFCLFDDGGRGSPEQPGLMAALDVADPGEPGCAGLAFRIPDTLVEEESRILWRREMIVVAYLPAFIEVETAQGPLRVLTFLADPAAEAVRRDIPAVQQAEMIARASGILGPNVDYLGSLVRHLRELELEDARMFDLWQRVSALRGAAP